MSTENIFDGWDNLDSSEDFFKVIDTQGSPSSTEEKDDEEEDLDEGIPEEEEEEEPTEKKGDDLFSSIDETIESEVKKEKGKDTKENQDLSDKVLFESLVKRGLVELDEGDEEFDLDNLEEGFLEESFENLIEKKIASKLDGLPTEVQNIVMHSLSGGDHRDFIKSLDSEKRLSLDFDIEEEENQEFAVKEFLRQEGEDEDFIKSQIEFLKEEGRLESYAKRRFAKWKGDKEAEQKELIKQQKEQKERARKNLLESRKVYQSLVSENKEIGGLPLDRKKAREIPAYLTEKTIKLDNGSKLSQFQRDLFFEIPKNPKALVQLAMLVKGRNPDGTFNFENISKNIETKVTRKLKDNVRRTKEITPGKNSGVTGTRSLADYFNN